LNCQIYIQTNSRLKARPENEVLAELERISASFVSELRSVLSGVDETIRALTTATNAANTTRFGLVSSLLTSTMQLMATGVVTEGATDVEDAIDSIHNGSARLRTCKLIRTKEEYKRLALSLDTESYDVKKQKPNA